MKRFKNMSKTKRIVAAGLTAGLTLGLASAAFAYFTSSGTGTGSATVGSSSGLTVATSPATGNALLPSALGDSNAVIDTVGFTVTNNAEGVQTFSTQTIEVTPGYTFTDLAGDPACTAADFSINGGTAGAASVISGLQTLQPASDAPANVYTSSATIQLVENGANQDSCEGQVIPLTVIAS